MTITPVEFHVSVTWENILDGVPTESSSCPVALSFWQRGSIQYREDEFQITSVSVGGESVELSAAGYIFVADLPEDIQQWIDAFDEKAHEELEGPELEAEKELRMNEFLPLEFDLRFYALNIDEDEEVPF